MFAKKSLTPLVRGFSTSAPRRFSFLFTFLLALFFAMSVNAAQAPEEAVLVEARMLVAKGEKDPSAFVRAIALLEGLSGAKDIRIPLLLAEAHYRMADPEADIEDTFPLYEKAAGYAKKALEIDSERPEGHYWHGLSELKRAQKKGGIRAYFIVRKAVRELEGVREAMGYYDHAGAARVLGLLYRVAPEWSPFGDTEKAIRMGLESVLKAPDYLLNRLYLARAYFENDDLHSAARQFRILFDAASEEGKTNPFREEAGRMLDKIRIQ